MEDLLCQLKEYCHHHNIQAVLSQIDDENITLYCPISFRNVILSRKEVEEFQVQVKKYDGVPFLNNANLEYTELKDPEIDGYSLYDMTFRCLIDENNRPFVVMKHNDRYAIYCTETENQFVFLDCFLNPKDDISLAREHFIETLTEHPYSLLLQESGLEYLLKLEENHPDL